MPKAGELIKHDNLLFNWGTQAHFEGTRSVTLFFYGLIISHRVGSAKEEIEIRDQRLEIELYI